MDTQKLHDLIDKVIGKNGPLRTPAYWMRRVLKGIMEDVGDLGERLNALKKKVDSIPANYPIREFEESDDYVSITPNEYSIIKCSKGYVNVILKSPTKKDIVNEYVIEVHPTESMTLFFPSTVSWVNDIPPGLTPHKTYVISIVDRIGVFLEF